MSDYSTDLLDGANGLAIEAHATVMSDHAKAVERNTRALRNPPAPTFSRYAGFGTTDDDGNLTINLGGPSQGRFWYVRSVVVGGADPTTTVAGTVDLFVLGGEPGQTQPGLADWRDRALSLPERAFYGRGELVLQNPERLYVRFLGALTDDAAAAVVCACSVEDNQTHAGPQDWSL